MNDLFGMTYEHWLTLEEHEKRWAINRDSKLLEEECLLLSDNIKIFDRFIAEAHAVARHRTHYSARTIVEVLRHNSLAHDNDPDFKISNNITPIMAYAATNLFPALNGLFTIKAERSKP